MVVSDSTRKVSEFRVISSDGKATIARATIKKYRDLPVAGPTSEESSTAARETCSMPENIVLEWKRELLSLDVVLKEVRINQFDTSKRAARFVQPTVAGYTPVNLAEVARQKAPASSTAVRETIPVPEPRSRVRLNPPLRIRGEDAAANTPRRQDQVRPKSPMLLPVLDLDVVDAPCQRRRLAGRPRLRHGSGDQPGHLAGAMTVESCTRWIVRVTLAQSSGRNASSRLAPAAQPDSHRGPVFGGIPQSFPGLGEDRPDRGLGIPSRLPISR